MTTCVGLCSMSDRLDTNVGLKSYSLKYLAVVAGDETLQFLQRLSATTRSKVGDDDWSLKLASNQPQPFPDFPGTRSRLELHLLLLGIFAVFASLQLAYSRITSLKLSMLICFHCLSTRQNIRALTCSDE